MPEQQCPDLFFIGEMQKGVMPKLGSDKNALKKEAG